MSLASLSDWWRTNCESFRVCTELRLDGIHARFSNISLVNFRKVVRPLGRGVNPVRGITAFSCCFRFLVFIKPWAWTVWNLFDWSFTDWVGFHIGESRWYWIFWLVVVNLILGWIKVVGSCLFAHHWARSSSFGYTLGPLSVILSRSNSLLNTLFAFLSNRKSLTCSERTFFSSCVVAWGLSIAWILWNDISADSSLDNLSCWWSRSDGRLGNIIVTWPWILVK